MHAISLSNRETCCLMVHMTIKLWIGNIPVFERVCVGSVNTCWLSITGVSFGISTAAGFLRRFQCEGMTLGRSGTCCCAAWPPSAGSLFGLSWVLFWSLPPATQESRGCSWPIRNTITQQSRCITAERRSRWVIHDLTTLLTSTNTWLVPSRWMFKTLISTQALSVFLQSST